MSEEELISIKNRLDKILNSGKEPVCCEELITTGELQRLLEEIERLNNIIKEAREYIGLTDEDREYLGIYDVNGIEILNILDKVELKENSK